MGSQGRSYWPGRGKGKSAWCRVVKDGESLVNPSSTPRPEGFQGGRNIRLVGGKRTTPRTVAQSTRMEMGAARECLCRTLGSQGAFGSPGSEQSI